MDSFQMLSCPFVIMIRSLWLASRGSEKYNVNEKATQDDRNESHLRQE